jgi:dipeptidyl aminopeptidase/acylaminoacyl peptidase
MQTFKLCTSSAFAKSWDHDGNVIRLWLAPGLAHIGAIFGEDIRGNQVGLCWDTASQRPIWEAVLYDDCGPYPDADFDRDLARVVYIASPGWESSQPSYLCVRHLASGVETRLGGLSSFFATIAPDGREVFARDRASLLRRWRVPHGLPSVDELTPDQKWSIRLPRGRSVDQQLDSGLAVLAVSPDGKRLAAGRHDGAVTAWNVTGPRKVASVPAIKGTKSRRYSVHRLVFSPDGIQLAAVRDKPRDKKRGFTVSVWTVPSGQEEKGPKEKVSVNGVAFSPDGHTLLTAREHGTVGVWDTTTWKLRREYAWKIGNLFSIAFSPDGLTCAAGGENGQVVIWDVDT